MIFCHVNLLFFFPPCNLQFCSSSGIEFLPFRAWVGIWIFIISTVTVALEGSVLVRSFTRFTMEIFALLISLIFIFEVFKKLFSVSREFSFSFNSYQYSCINNINLFMHITVHTKTHTFSYWNQSFSILQINSAIKLNRENFIPKGASDF